LLANILVLPITVRAQGLDTAKIDAALGRSGQRAGEVYRVGFPRTDLHVIAEGVDIKPGLALGSWAAFSGNDQDAMVMGDLVLLEGEVNPVIRKLRSSGFEITAVHNHLINEKPHVLYVHYMGHGNAAQIAQSLRAGLAESATPLDKPTQSAPAEAPPFAKTIEDVLGVKGRWSGSVLAFGIPRAEPIVDGGLTLTSAQGVAESINFQEVGNARVVTTGDFALIADEVNPVISALLDHGIKITALHSHLLTEQPRVFFMHFWGLGESTSVAQGIKAALDKVNTKAPPK
jgi:hypothetical protein